MLYNVGPIFNLYEEILKKLKAQTFGNILAVKEMKLLEKQYRETVLSGVISLLSDAILEIKLGTLSIDFKKCYN